MFIRIDIHFQRLFDLRTGIRAAFPCGEGGMTLLRLNKKKLRELKDSEKLRWLSTCILERIVVIFTIRTAFMSPEATNGQIVQCWGKFRKLPLKYGTNVTRQEIEKKRIDSS